MTTEELRELRDRWRGEGVDLVPGASLEQFARFEQRFGVALPADLRLFYSVIGGCQEASWFHDLLRLWPLDEIVPATECLALPLDPGLFVFIDWAIHAEHWAVALREGRYPLGAIVKVSGQPLVVAPSISALVREFLTVGDPWSVLNGESG